MEMQGSLLDESKSYLQFTQADAENLVLLRPLVEPLIPTVVKDFYDVLLRHPRARAVLQSIEQVERLKMTLGKWLRELFGGEYGEQYLHSRMNIGRTHVRVGMPPEYMPLAMEVIRSSLEDALVAAGATKNQVRSLQKLLQIDLTIMLSSYNETYAAQVREYERRALEVKLARAQHLAEIGQLAASLAHEIKNPLAGISGAIQVIGESLPPGNPHKQIVPEILAQISRLDATVKDLLLYARPSPPSLKPVALRELVCRTVGLLQQEPALQNRRVEYSGPDRVVEADERQLEQLLVNLILNAAHASPPTTPIEVETTEADHSIGILVRDYGCGMSPEIKRRAMEPFFTTKAKGTGLGLAICRRIAESHGGNLCIESELGKGTVVKVELPRREQENELDMEYQE